MMLRGVVVGGFIAAASLAACSDVQTAPRGVLPLRASRLTSNSFSTIYRFQGGKDGENPVGGLAVFNGNLYGTTFYGGNSRCYSNPGCGTVFVSTTAGQEQVIHRFHGSDGQAPGRPLVVLNGKLYGTSAGGKSGSGSCGNGGCGIVFSITPLGHERVLYRFKGGSDGAFPQGLVVRDGKLYGLTGGGGGNNTYCATGCGTVFEVDTAGRESVIYRFKGGSDGEYPVGSLVALRKAFYGVTTLGGVGCDIGCGTVFAVNKSGKKRTVYEFTGAPDGSGPQSGLTNVSGTLYGTTYSGGSVLGCNVGCGTVFTVRALGREQVLYSFAGAPDGALPNGPLFELNGAFYSTTNIGGSSNLGTIFSVTTAGAEQVIYSFQGGSDGDGPDDGLVGFSNVLYGTAASGGGTGCATNGGCGTIFSVSPASLSRGR
jgi:uncharacterized repeat protein (TIGR03803 family)